MNDKIISFGQKKALGAGGDNSAWTMMECLEYALKEKRENPDMKDFNGGMVIFYRKNAKGFSHRTLTSNLDAEAILALLSTELHQTIADD